MDEKLEPHGQEPIGNTGLVSDHAVTKTPGEIVREIQSGLRELDELEGEHLKKARDVSKAKSDLVKGIIEQNAKDQPLATR